jgi:hypothetical protein
MSKMNKDDVEQIRIDITCDGQSALSMMLCRDGTIARQGNGHLPAQKASVLGRSDGSVFREIMEMVSDELLQHQAVYDHPQKQGLPVTYSIVFIGPKPRVTAFEFRLGSENRDVGDLLPYFDRLISRTVALTDEWYSTAQSPRYMKGSTEHNVAALIGMFVGAICGGVLSYVLLPWLPAWMQRPKDVVVLGAAGVGFIGGGLGILASKLQAASRRRKTPPDAAKT